MKISGVIIHNGARYEFISLSGDFKFVYRNLLSHMKKWGVRFGHIDIDGDWKYSVCVGADYILINRWPKFKICLYNRKKYMGLREANLRKVELSTVYGSVKNG